MSPGRVEDRRKGGEWPSPDPAACVLAFDPMPFPLHVDGVTSMLLLKTRKLKEVRNLAKFT